MSRAARMGGMFVLSGFLGACGGGIGTTSGEPDPVVQDYPVAYIQRSLPEEGQLNSDLREPLSLNPGAVLFIRDRASPSALQRDISSRAFSDPSFLDDEGLLRYDVKNVSASYDGQRLLFSMRAPGDEDDETITWNIWEYDVAGDALRRVIPSNTIAESGHDISPVYLPDGRILFSSSRQRQAKAILIDEGKPQFEALDESRDQPSMSLHVMNADGSDIQQITFNPSMDLMPLVQESGKILFTRWDNAGSRNSMNIYQVNPDGTQLEYRYGNHSHSSGDQGDTVQFSQLKQLESGTIVAALRPYQVQNLGGAFVEIDIAQFTDNDVTVSGLDLAGQTAQSQFWFNSLSTGDAISAFGRLNGFSPLYDNTDRLLVSWSQCRLVDPTDTTSTTRYLPCSDANLSNNALIEAAPIYGIYIYDPAAQTQLPVVAPQEGIFYSEPVVLRERAIPEFIPDYTGTDAYDEDLALDGWGVLTIKSVYDFDGTDTSPGGLSAVSDPAQTSPDNRPARFLRLVKSVAMPNDDVLDLPNTAFGASRGQLMRDILGYAPIEPDGSVQVKVPANVPFAISIVDQSGRRISQRHQNWLFVRPGETLSCIGCHTSQSSAPHGRVDAQPASINSGASTTGLPFPNTRSELFANMGETMAETWSRIKGIRTPQADMIYADEWTDALLATPGTEFQYLYSANGIDAPTLNACTENWRSTCRITINYESHIHPLWNKTRQVLDADEVTVLEDYTCTQCHSPTDAMATAQTPAAQLDLTDGPSTDQPDHFKSYRELFFRDNEQEVVDGLLIDRLIPVLDDQGQPVFEVDAEGELILDAEENPIPVLTTVSVQNTMSVGGANNSSRFFAPFAAGGSHEGWLLSSELKLLYEWLDIGAQYFNNPFDVPQD